MQQNPFLRQNPTRSTDTALSTRPEYRLQLFNRPFHIRRRSISPLDHHQVSTSAHWTNRQKEKYLLFVCYYRDHFKTQSYGKVNWEIFKGMAKFVQTRNPQQCRSHHIKLLKHLNSIENYIRIALEKAPNLRAQLLQAEQKLIEIQSQFKLNSINMGIEREDQLQNQQQNLIHYYQGGFPSQQIIGKKQNQDNIKTADSYYQEQNPVNSNNNSNYNFDNRFGFKPFQSEFKKTQRPSIPSFGDEQDQSIDDNKILKNSNQQPKIAAFNNEIIDEVNLDNEKLAKQAFIERFGKEKSVQKLKQFMQCHYYFQLWADKLEKLMGEEKDNCEN